jgi:hypothetical protein
MARRNKLFLQLIQYVILLNAQLPKTSSVATKSLDLMQNETCREKESGLSSSDNIVTLRLSFE